MEDRILNEKESFELITRMIRNSKRNVRQNAGGPALIWGYATVLTSLLVYGSWILTGNNMVMWGWFFIPVFGSIGTYWFNRTRQTELTKTYLDRVVNYIWLVLGLVCWGVAVAAFVFSFPILFFISLLMGMGITLTGCVTNYKMYIYFGVTGILLSFLCLIVHGPEQILVFAGNFIIMMIIPGHILNYELKKELLKINKEE